MGWAHLGFWGSLIAFTLVVVAIHQRWRYFERRSRLDDESRMKFLSGTHKSKEDKAEDEKEMKVLAWCFCAVCLFGHLAGSPLEDTLNSYVEWADSLELGD